MSQYTYTNESDTNKYLVYAPPLGVSLSVETILPGETWLEGAMECAYEVFDTLEEANAFIDRQFVRPNERADIPSEQDE